MAGSSEMIVRPLITANEPCACLFHSARGPESHRGAMAGDDDVPKIVRRFTRDLSGAGREHTHRAVHQSDLIILTHVLGHRSRIAQAAEGTDVEDRAVR